MWLLQRFESAKTALALGKTRQRNSSNVQMDQAGLRCDDYMRKGRYMKKVMFITVASLILAGCGQSGRNGMGSGGSGQSGSGQSSSSAGQSGTAGIGSSSG